MKYLISLLFILSAAFLQAQDVTVTVDCPPIIRTGEPFQMAVQVNANASTPKFPPMDAFTILRGPSRSQSSQTSIVNGKVSQSMSLTFTYIAQASKEGTQVIPPVEVTVDKKTYQSQPVTVQVVAGNASTQPGASQQSTVPSQADNSQVQADNRDVFVSVIPNRTKLYQGEYLTATVKLYSKLSISSLTNVVFPTFEGFFKQEIETPPLRNLDPETVNGTTYYTGVIQRFVLFPQKSGTLTINPCTMEVGIQQRVQTRSRSIFDDFFGGSVQTIPRELKSNPVNITVLPLPDGKPASFTGGVGQLDFKAALDKTEVKANDPVTLTLTVSGTGNIRFVDAPRINFPPDFEVYDPKISNNLNAVSTTGNKTFEYLIIPRHGGTYRIPSVEFGYFDPQTKQYKTIRTDEFVLEVERGEEQPGTTVIGGVTREDVKFLGQDIRYIKTGKIILRPAGDIFFGTWKFWLCFIIPLAGFILIVYLRRKYISKYSDAVFVKHRRANKFAAKRLKQANHFMNKGQQEAFYEELSRALWGYLGDKLAIPVAELSRDTVKSTLEQHQVDEQIANEFIGVIDDCEFARYAPAAGADMNTLYSRAVDTINKMQKQM